VSKPPIPIDPPKAESPQPSERREPTNGEPSEPPPSDSPKAELPPTGERSEPPPSEQREYPTSERSELLIAFSPIYKYELPEGHRFPMVKYELIPEQLVYEGTIKESQFFHPEPVSEEVLLWTHDPDYWHKLKTQTLSRKEERAIGFPMSEKLVRRGTHIANGTLEGALHARKNGIAMNIAGGTHHAFAHRGEGFCVGYSASNYLC
jgi:hypothetical protein